jgi:AraC-like DNA-binding protein
MINGYEFLKYQPEVYKQLACKGMTFIYYDCPQALKRVDIFTHFNILSFVIRGKKLLHRPGKSWLLEEGKCYFFKKGAFNQELYLDEGWRSMNLYIPDNYLRPLIRDYYKYYKGKSLNSHTSDYIFELEVNEMTSDFRESMLASFTQQPAVDEELLEERFRELFYSILSNKHNHTLVSYLNNLADRQKTSLFEIMETNYMYNLSLQEYAKIANRSLATFKREFKTLFYTTPSKWLINKRLDYAQLMLNTTKKNVNDIMMECGFENSSHFSRVFKEKFGASPLNYRKEQVRSAVM